MVDAVDSGASENMGDKADRGLQDSSPLKALIRDSAGRFFSQFIAATLSNNHVGNTNSQNATYCTAKHVRSRGHKTAASFDRNNCTRYVPYRSDDC